MTRQTILLFLVAYTTTITLSTAFPQRNASTLIVGGEEANKGEFPFIVDLRRLGSHSCAGSIVNSEWVVTAAHCAQGSVGDYVLVAGDHNNNLEEGTEQRRNVERIINHPSYRPATYENDISLMKVSQPFVLNERIQAVALPSAGFEPTKDTTVAGWGRTTEGGVSSNLLLKVTVPHVPDDQCRTSYGATRITDTMICAGVEGEGGKDACQGDSGGPLMCYTSATTAYMCGIVSWGTGCARPNYPGVYTETSYFTQWVNSAINSS